MYACMHVHFSTTWSARYIYTYMCMHAHTHTHTHTHLVREAEALVEETVSGVYRKLVRILIKILRDGLA